MRPAPRSPRTAAASFVPLVRPRIQASQLPPDPTRAPRRPWRETRRGGKIWFKIATRLPAVLGMLAAVDSAETILEGYAWLERDDIQACLVYARRMVGHERVEPRILKAAG